MKETEEGYFEKGAFYPKKEEESDTVTYTFTYSGEELHDYYSDMDTSAAIKYAMGLDFAVESEFVEKSKQELEMIQSVQSVVSSFIGILTLFSIILSLSQGWYGTGVLVAVVFGIILYWGLEQDENRD